MKRIILSITILCLGLTLQAQKNPVDELFKKYGDRQGITVVTISGKMFNMFASQEPANSPEANVMSKLNSIRILTVEDHALNREINFYSELSKSLDFSAYEELMVVKEGQDVTKFLVKQKGNTISELLVITGGPGENSLISITGDLDMKSLSNISREMGIQELEGLEKEDGKK